jgi:hypothetical protein
MYIPLLSRPRWFGEGWFHQCALSLAGGASRGRQLALCLRLQIGQHAGAAFNAVADFHVDFGRGGEQHIDTGTKLDQADALAALEAVADLGLKHDAPRQQARNLLEDDGLAVAVSLAP